MIDGANQFQGPASLWWAVRHWPALRKEMTGARGYIAHRVWYVFPLTLGITSWWQDENAAYRFAHLPVHRTFWRWAASGGKTKGGWLASYRYVSGGPLWGNGVESMMSRLGAFVPAPSRKPPNGPPGE